MAKTIILFLALFVFVAHCHVLKDKEPGHSKKPEHKIEKRSCFVCDNDDNGPPPMPHPGHPPPPPFFRKRNWGNGADGSQQGALSEASSSADTGTGSQASGNDGDDSGGQNGAGFNGQKNFGELGNYKENHNSFQSGYNKQFGGGGGRGFEGPKQTQSSEFGAGVGDQGSVGGSKSGSASSAQAYGSGSSGNEQQSFSGGFGHGHGQGHRAARYQQSDSFNSGQWQEKGFGTGTAGSSQNGAGVPGGNGAGADAGREALNGALNLAYQVVETQQASSCSTCGKSNYAISNAKSDSGNAIAVSIGR